MLLLLPSNRVDCEFLLQRVILPRWQISESFSNVTLLTYYPINNAGRNQFMPLMGEEIEAAKYIFDIIFWDTLAVTQAFIPPAIKVRGVAVNNALISGYINVPWMGKFYLSPYLFQALA